MRIGLGDLHLLKGLSKDKAKEIRRDLATAKAASTGRLQSAYLAQTGSSIILSKDPQQILTAALRHRLGELVESEKTGLIKGRKFRADIFIGLSNLVIEFDGYQFHKSLEAFQNDRVKRNLLVQFGYPVMSFFYKQIQDDLDGVVNQIVDTHQFYINVFKDR